MQFPSAREGTELALDDQSAQVSPSISMTAAPPQSTRQRFSLVIAGHVDHGKSTVIGRLLFDTGSLPEGKLELVRALCERSSRPFEYAFLLDALKDEQAQGITIDTARVFFKTAARDYIILDAPGHVEFLRNMVTGASRAEAALLVIDAKEGIQDNSRRHGYLMSLLGLRQLAVLVNKMDQVGFDQGVFDTLARDYTAFLAEVGLAPAHVIPVCARDGDNLASRSDRLAWYRGPTVLESLDAFRAAPPPNDKPFRMPVQDVYKFTAQGDDRRIVAGTIETGRFAIGDEIVFYPSGKRAHVQTIEAFNAPAPQAASAGEATGFTLSEQIYVTRGELATRAAEPAPRVTTRLRASIFWLGREPLSRRKDYLLKLGSAKVPMRVEQVHRVIDAATLAELKHASAVERHAVAECTLQLARAVAVDLAEDLPATGRFVIVDDYEIRGGGIVRETLPDAQEEIRNRVLLRNAKWEPSAVPLERRAERYSQKPALLLITGQREADRKGLARALETRLFEDGRLVYFLGIGNLLYGVDADLSRDPEQRGEHIRRLAEVANILLDTGLILVVTAAELTQEDIQLVRTTLSTERILTAWLGESITSDLSPDLLLSPLELPSEAVERLRRLLQDAGVVFRAW
jgi:bifunctional enzyme CysN/CysC